MARGRKNLQGPFKFGEELEGNDTGRPSKFNADVAAEICARISIGQSLRTICKDEHMPGIVTVYNWLGDSEKQNFLKQYLIAKSNQADYYAESIVDISDEEVTMVKRSKHGNPDDEGEIEVVFDPTAVARNKLRVDARKWYASKVAPKRYGDRLAQEISGPDGNAIEHNVNITAEEAYLAMIGKK
jgi:hypothetical protein